MSKLSALEKFLAKTKKLEGETGAPFLETKAKNLFLRLLDVEDEWPASTKLTQRDTWQLRTKQPDNLVGSFSVRHQDGEPYGEMKGSAILGKFHGRGMGQAAYQTLADHYGGIASDSGETSAKALRVYDKLAPESFLDKLPGLPRLLGKNGVGERRRFIPGAPRKHKGWGIFGEDD